jgi:diguanylate cyclase (GGDEF)-like protein
LDEPLLNFVPHVRKLPGKKKTPIFLISNAIQKSFISEALEAGVSDFIHEPLDALEIHERISVQFHSSKVNKKIRNVTGRIKPLPSIPRNTELFSGRTLIGDKALRAIIETKKKMHPLSLFMVQVDRFHQIEHELRRGGIGELTDNLEIFLRSHLRPHDFLIKEGPATYLILLPKTSQRAAKLIAEDIRNELSVTPVRTGSEEILLTVSIGVISFENEPSESGKLFEQFTRSLESVKKSLDESHKKNALVFAEQSK